MWESVEDILGATGPFATKLSGFAPRSQQQEMARVVSDALTDHALLIAEAGTGTGKTFAYLVPTLLSGQKVIISTGTKTLQDQLFHKDIPLVRDALAVPVDVALLKGRANYLCPYRLETVLSQGRFGSRREASDVQIIKRWSGQTESGDIAELTELSEDAMVWGQVTSTADNCLGSDCDYIEQCYVVHARRRAQVADVLVVNHHLLFADMALRDEGGGELLPGANAFILDEAHQLPELASSFFGLTVSGNQLMELVQDTIAADIREAGETQDLRKTAEALATTVRELRLALGEGTRRAAWHEVAGDDSLQTAVSALCDKLQALRPILEAISERGKGLESCARRCTELEERFTCLIGETPPDTIHWFETHTRSFTINHTPLDVAPLMREKIRAQKCAWIFTSATLAIGDCFDHFSHRMGLDEPRTARWDSPFDFPHQALLYVPHGLPNPNSPDYTTAVVESAIRILHASRGRAFLLFTSHRALQEAAERLEGAIDFPLLVQGEAPRTRLLERFRELGNAVLLGTGSFWEGVDVRGEVLSCVIIDKLPFASPVDPVVQARIEAMRTGGGNPFMDYQLPQAVIALKQGVGRLIRDVTDSGVLVLCDPRLDSRGYGRTFVDSLPPMSKTRRLEVVQRFFETVAKDG